jgi:hypothetical protein
MARQLYDLLGTALGDRASAVLKGSRASRA